MPSTKSPQKRKKIVHARVVEPVVAAEALPEEQRTLPESSSSKRVYLYALLAVAIFAAGIFAGFLKWGYKPAPKPTVYNIDTTGFPSLGPADAPVVIVEYSDFQCPYCYRAYETIYKPLLAAYPGKIRFVYRNFPLSFHQNALAAAEAALCAGDQNAYWEYHNTLFDHNAVLNNEEGSTLDSSVYIRYAADLGLDTKVFEKCLTSQKYREFIVKDVEAASKLPDDKVANECGDPVNEAAIGGTPTFFINGHRIGGVYPIEEFKKIINAELAK